MVWNYRIIRKTAPGNHVFFEIHEVYYAADGATIESWTENPIAPYGETADELRRSMELMEQAFARPILEIKTVDGEEMLFEAAAIS